MATRERRMAEFKSTEPPANQPLQLLCEDHCGTYVIPFACQFISGEWRGVARNQLIEATVLGWRPPYNRSQRA
jgi:hypothetical protein